MYRSIFSRGICLKYDILLVFLGGGFGAVIRELLVMLIPSESLLSLPVFIANMTASFFVGILAGLISKSKITGSQSAFLSVGLMGGLSTFSTFIYEIVLQIKTIDAVLIDNFYCADIPAHGASLILVSDSSGTVCPCFFFIYCLFVHSSPVEIFSCLRHSKVAVSSSA